MNDEVIAKFAEGFRGAASGVTPRITTRRDSSITHAAGEAALAPAPTS
jgi:hypothetical protein